MSDTIQLGNHAPDWEPTVKDVPQSAEVGAADLEELGKIRALGATHSDMTAAFGEPIDEGKSVRWEVDKRKDPQAFGKLKELTQAKRRAEMERSSRWNAGIRRVQMVDPQTGATDVVPEEHEDLIGRRRGLRRARPFAAMNKVERGPDGMLFRYVNGWMPTGRTCLGTPLDPNDSGEARGVQRDPSGKMWAVRNSSWSVLEDGTNLTGDELQAILEMEN